jgi:CRISPR/Cas system-associated protein Csx1
VPESLIRAVQNGILKIAPKYKKRAVPENVIRTVQIGAAKIAAKKKKAVKYAEHTEPP